jgi:beta-glucanase (GH16 family)
MRNSTALAALALALCSPIVAAEWTLVWSDEFEQSGLPDPSKWTYERGFIRNNELQFYTHDRLENVRVQDGRLIIEARKEQFPNSAWQQGSRRWQLSRENAQYTSGSITTEGKASWKYGRIEVRAKLPTGRGTWPAIWMLGVNHKEAGWPRCGEIDIMENVGYDPDVIHANVHTQAYNHVKKTNKGNKTTVSKPYDDFHVYAVEWHADRMEFFVDGRNFFSFANENTGVETWPFDQPFYLILNIAIGGGWGGTKGVDESIFPQRMEVDYVRVYEATT